MRFTLLLCQRRNITKCSFDLIRSEKMKSQKINAYAFQYNAKVYPYIIKIHLLIYSSLPFSISCAFGIQSR